MSVTGRQAAYVQALVDELARVGVRHAFVAPGSRNTPLSLALVGQPAISVHVVVDERVAAYAALGVGRATGVPAIVSCTSGTAAVNFHPAVVEADVGYVPLLALTADRPARLRGTGANQTIDQHAIYGSAVRHAADLAPFDVAAPDARDVARAGFEATVAPQSGPAHLNLQFDEPLLPAGPRSPRMRPDFGPTLGGRGSTRVELPAARRPVVVAGWGADVAALPAGWPVLADPLSGLRHGPDAVSTYEALVRVPGLLDRLRPDLVVRVGALPSGKGLYPWIDGDIPQVLVLPDGRGADPFGRARVVVAPHAELVATDAIDPEWTGTWRTFEAEARAALDAALDAFPTLFDARVARDVAATVAPGGRLFVGSSMPVRDLEYAMAPRADLVVDANRGASGIDGVMATAFGAALAAPERETTVLLGDLSFLHDTNALLLRSTGARAVVVVLDNDGGGIFEFLPQRAAVPEHFEALFGTPHGLDLVAVARAHRVDATLVEDPDAVASELVSAHARGGVQVLVVRSDREENRLRHTTLWDAVAAAVGPRPERRSQEGE